MTNAKRKEILEIRNSYTEKKPSKTEELKALDNKVKTPVLICAYTFGSIAALVFGGGMCLSMKVIGESLPDFVGIAVGVGGMLLCGLNYVVYKIFLKKRKAKYAEAILKLCDEAENDEVIA